MNHFFFVRGYQKSGTNWVRNICNLHPRVSARGEYHFTLLMEGVQKFLTVNDFTQKFKPITQKFTRDFITTCMTHDFEDGFQAADRFVDVTPWSGGVLESQMPFSDSRYILISRDGRDVLVSQIYHRMRRIIKDPLSDEVRSLVDRYPWLIEKADKIKKNKSYFSDHPEELLQDKEYIQEVLLDWAWCTREENKLIENKNYSVCHIRYEDLHTNFQQMQHKIYEFLEVNPSEASGPGELETPGFKEEDALSHYRRGVVGEWRKYFTPEMTSWINELIHDELLMRGYDL